jgi:hypothetical protein
MIGLRNDEQGAENMAGESATAKSQFLSRVMSAKLAVVAMLIAALGLMTAAASEGAGGHAVATADATAHAASPGRPFNRTELYFGLSKPDGEVTEEEFQHFLDVEVTKRFPDGLTLLSGLGQFQDGGTVVKEKSKLLILLYPLTDRQANAEIEEIREAYKATFDQFSVLRVDAIERVSF